MVRRSGGRSRAVLHSYLPEFARIGSGNQYGEAGEEVHRKKPGSTMTVSFELNGQPFVALNGGPMFEFTPAISFQVHCDTQEDVDYYWERLSEGGDPNAPRCGWLKDRFGVSWQVVPNVLMEILQGPSPEGARRAMEAMFQMSKLDVAELRRAYKHSAAF